MIKGLQAIYEPTGKAGEYAKLALNLFRGCLNGCTYCYVPGFTHMDKTEFATTCTVRQPWKRKLERDLLILRHHKLQEVEVMMSFTSDPFQPVPELQLVTHEAITMMKEAKQRFGVLTKTPGNMLARTAPLFKGESFGITLTRIVSFKIEPGAENWMKRIAALKMMKDLGASTWISFEPAISSNDINFFYDKTKDFCDLYRVGAASKRLSDIDYHIFVKELVQRFKNDGTNYCIKENLRMFL